MKLAIAIVAAIVTGTALAQGRFTGPFTGYEAEALSDVWPEIREAARFEDINWRAHGLDRAPGTPEAQRMLSANWNELRREARFENIDWDEYYDSRYSDGRYSDGRYSRSDERYARSSRSDRYGRAETGFPEDERGYNDSPFTREEAAAMSRAWGQIREAARFEDINWRAMGFSGPPGDRDARRIMSRYWGELREAGSFEDIDWQATTGYRAR
jgi:hypothetical protein